jgi:hypothetical protein
MTEYLVNGIPGFGIAHNLLRAQSRCTIFKHKKEPSIIIKAKIILFMILSFMIHDSIFFVTWPYVTENFPIRRAWIIVELANVCGVSS